VSDTMSWYWIAVALVLPLALSLLVAWPFWGRCRDALGSGVGACVIFVFAVAFVGREVIHVQLLTGQCIASRTHCIFYPEPFTRFCIYGFIAMAQTFVLFAVDAAVESRIESRAFAKEWRR
jgi:hypothetical protein